MDLKQIYNEVFESTAGGHGSALSAVWNAAVTETNKVRDEAAKLVSGVDVEALQAEGASLKLQLDEANAKIAELTLAHLEVVAAATPEQPAPVAATPEQPASVVGNAQPEPAASAAVTDPEQPAADVTLPKAD